jgi:uncharacterized protein (TIGR00369 family)
MKMTEIEISDFLAVEFPQIDGEFVVDQVDDDAIVMRLPVADRHLRPGGTVSGPSMFALADVSFYVAVLAHVGPKALAVTTNCNIDFMRKPAAGQDLLGKATVLKLGRSLIVGDVMIYSEGMNKPVARASLTYSVPN